MPHNGIFSRPCLSALPAASPPTGGLDDQGSSEQSYRASLVGGYLRDRFMLSNASNAPANNQEPYYPGCGIFDAINREGRGCNFIRVQKACKRARQHNLHGRQTTRGSTELASCLTPLCACCSPGQVLDRLREPDAGPAARAEPHGRAAPHAGRGPQAQPAQAGAAGHHQAGAAHLLLLLQSGE